jgi:hypothetical protein
VNSQRLGPLFRERHRLREALNAAHTAANEKIARQNELVRNVVLTLSPRERAVVEQSAAVEREGLALLRERDRAAQDLTQLEVKIADLLDVFLTEARRRDSSVVDSMREIAVQMSVLARKLDGLAKDEAVNGVRGQVENSAAVLHETRIAVTELRSSMTKGLSELAGATRQRSATTGSTDNDRLGRLADEIAGLARSVRRLESAFESMRSSESMAGLDATLGDLCRAVDELRAAALRQAGLLYSVAASVDVLSDEGQGDPVDRVDSASLPEEPGAEEPPTQEQLAQVPDRTVALLFASSPKGAPVDVTEEMREVQQELHHSTLGDRIDLVLSPATRITDLFELLNRHKPRLIHFSGHGTEDGIVLLTPQGRANPITAGALLEVVAATVDPLPLVFFNICQSAGFAEEAAQHVDAAIGMDGDIHGLAARVFARRLYNALASGRSLTAAFHQGIAALRGQHFPDHSIPLLFHRRGVNAGQVFLVRPPEKSLRRP